MPATIIRTTRRGLTVLELLVTMGITAILAGLMLPAIGAARESARRTVCVNHLKELGLANHSHHDSRGHLPVGWQFDPSGSSAYGWAVSLLPYVGEPALRDQIDEKLPADAERNNDARETLLSLMLCPSDITEPSFVLYEQDPDEGLENGDGSLQSNDELHPLIRLPTANYIGMFGTFEMDDSIPAPIGDGAFLENREVKFRDFQRGLSRTLLIGERTMAQVPSTWYAVEMTGEDAPARLVGAALEGINNPYADECDYSSRHPGGANFVYADGHVEFLTEDIDLQLYHESARLRLQGGN